MADETLSLQHARLRRRFRLVTIALLALLLAALAFVLYGRFRKPAPADERSVADMLHALDSVSNRAKTFENANGRLVTDNAALVAKSEGMLRDMSAAVFNLKSDQERLVKQVNYLTLVKQQVRYDSVFLRYDTTHAIPLIAAGRSDSIGVPQSFAMTDSFGAVYGRVLKTGVSLDSMWAANSMYLRHGVRKKGFMNLGREDFVQAVNNNPHMRTTGLGTVTYHQKPGAWNRWIKPVAAAVVSAVITYKVVK